MLPDVQFIRLPHRPPVWLTGATGRPKRDKEAHELDVRPTHQHTRPDDSGQHRTTTRPSTDWPLHRIPAKYIHITERVYRYNNITTIEHTTLNIQTEHNSVNAKLWFSENHIAIVYNNSTN